MQEPVPITIQLEIVLLRLECTKKINESKYNLLLNNTNTVLKIIGSKDITIFFDLDLKKRRGSKLEDKEQDLFKVTEERIVEKITTMTYATLESEKCIITRLKKYIDYPTYRIVSNINNKNTVLKIIGSEDVTIFSNLDSKINCCSEVDPQVQKLFDITKKRVLDKVSIITNTTIEHAKCIISLHEKNLITPLTCNVILQKLYFKKFYENMIHDTYELQRFNELLNMKLNIQQPSFIQKIKYISSGKNYILSQDLIKSLETIAQPLQWLYNNHKINKNTYDHLKNPKKFIIFYTKLTDFNIKLFISLYQDILNKKTNVSNSIIIAKITEIVSLAINDQKKLSTSWFSNDSEKKLSFSKLNQKFESITHCYDVTDQIKPKILYLSDPKISLEEEHVLIRQFNERQPSTLITYLK